MHSKLSLGTGILFLWSPPNLNPSMSLRPYRHPQKTHNPQFLRHAIQRQGQFCLLSAFLMVTLVLWWLVQIEVPLLMSQHTTSWETQCGPPFSPNVTGSSRAGRRHVGRQLRL